MSLNTQLFETIKPLTQLNQFSGLFTGSLRELNTRKKDQWSYILAVHLLVIILTALTLSYYCYPNIVTFKGILIIKILEFACMHSYIVLMLTDFSLNFIQKSKYLNYIHDVSTLSNRFRDFGIRINYKQIQNELKCNLLIVTLIWVIDFFHYNLNLNSNSRSSVTQLIYWVAYNIAPKVTYLQILEMSTHVNILKAHFKAINNTLEDLNKKLPQQNIGGEFYLKRVQLLHCELCQINSKFNCLYSLQLLLTITNQFIVILTGSFFTIFGYYYDGQFVVPRTFLQLSIPLMILSTPLLGFWLIVSKCESTNQESQRTSVLLNLLEIQSINNILKKTVSLFKNYVG